MKADCILVKNSNYSEIVKFLFLSIMTFVQYSKGTQFQLKCPIVEYSITKMYQSLCYRCGYVFVCGVQNLLYYNHHHCHHHKEIKAM